MYKYIVTWVLIKLIPIPCPDFAVKTDDFGRTQSLYISCSAYHAIIDSANMSKQFTNRSEAVLFYKKAITENKSILIMGRESIRNVKLDSVKIKNNP